MNSSDIAALRQEIESVGDTLRKAISSLVPLLPLVYTDPEAKNKCTTVLAQWAYVSSVGMPDSDYLSFCLPESANATFHVEEYNKVYTRLCQLKLALRHSLPGPSEFARQWSHYQDIDKSDVGPILCLRPPNKRGLPLCILHDVFRQFQLSAQNQVPNDAEKLAVAASCSAAKLCALMGESFSSSAETDDPLPLVSREDTHREQRRRKDAFMECIDGLLGVNFVQQYALNPTSETHGGTADVAILENQCPIALAVMKAEHGTAGGDVYMQAVRTYDLAAKLVARSTIPNTEAFIRHGAPMFVLCVCGPQLMIVGGFHDGDATIVEPLGGLNLMLEDDTKERQSRLAGQLYALAKGIEVLRGLVRDRTAYSQEYPPSTPRIYKTCKLYDDPQEGIAREGNLKFLRKLELPTNNRLLFSATLVTGISTEVPVLAKLVPRTYGYGDDIQRILAEQGLAPKLYGYSRIEGAPTAYVMEYLQPRSWRTLFEYFQLEGASKPLPAIREALDLIINTLESNGKVHGDLRSSNIMIEVSDSGEAKLLGDHPQSTRANLKVVDFDWAGDAGQVRYTQTRNEELPDIIWPGEPGGLIEAGHDRSLVNSWWPPA